MPAQSPRSMRGLFVRSIAGPQSYALTQPDQLVASSSPTPNVLVVSPPFTVVPVPGAQITSSRPLGNPAVGTPGPLVVSTQPAASATRAATFSAPQQPATASSAVVVGPLVVGPEFSWPLIPPVLLGASQPLGNPAVASPQPVIVTPAPFTWPLVPSVSVTASQPLGNPAVGTASALVVSPPQATPAVFLAQIFQAPQVAAAVAATTTPTALVVTPPQQPTPVPAPRLFASPSQPGAPAPLVVGLPFTAVPVPGADISSSQPLGTPAVGTPSVYVVTTTTAAKVPGAFLSSNPAAPAAVLSVNPPQALVVTPAQVPPPVPRPLLGAGSATTATGQILVVNAAATPAPILAIRIFGAPTAAPAVPSTPTSGPLVIGPPWRPVAIPKTFTSANYPLGNAAVASPQPIVVSPTFRWPTWTASLVGTGATVHSCTTTRPGAGVTVRPGTGITAYALATTARPSSGITTRPDSGTTEDPC